MSAVWYSASHSQESRYGSRNGTTHQCPQIFTRKFFSLCFNDLMFCWPRSLISRERKICTRKHNNVLLNWKLNLPLVILFSFLWDNQLKRELQCCWGHWPHCKGEISPSLLNGGKEDYTPRAGGILGFILLSPHSVLAFVTVVAIALRQILAMWFTLALTGLWPRTHFGLLPLHPNAGIIDVHKHT